MGTVTTRRLARTRARRTSRAITSFLVGAVALAGLGVGGFVYASAGAAVPVMTTTPTTYKGAAFPVTVTSPSADKPQSKLWYVDNTWWGLFTNDTGALVRELKTDHTWGDGLMVDARPTSTADAVWINGKLSIVSRTTSGSVRYYRLSYASATRTWSIDAGFPVTISGTGARSAAIAVDSNGIVWMTYTKTTTVFVSHSTAADAKTWTAPVAVPVPDSTVTSGDISGIVAFGGNKVGIMWSDQETAAQQPAMRFAWHVDGDLDTAWTLETVYQGTGIADNHINLKTIANDAEGRIYAAVKTSFDVTGTATDPLLRVLVRAGNGTWTWTTLATVADAVTRPQLAIDNETGTLYALFTGPTSGGSIYYKTSSVNSVSFAAGKGTLFMSAPGAVLNNVSTMRDNVSSTTGLVAIASDDTNHFYYHAELGLAAPAGDTTKPTAPTSITATPSGSSVALSWSGATDNVGVDHYEVSRTSGSTTTLLSSAVTGTSYNDTGLADGTYTYSVVAVDAANNKSSAAVSAAVAINTAPPAGTIAFVSGSTQAVGPGTSLVVSKPAGTLQGHVMLATVSSRGAPTITAPAGWTKVVETTNGTTMRQTVFSKVAGASEPATYTFTLNASKNAAVQVDTYSGVSTTTPVRTAAGQLNASSSVISAPSVTANAGDQVVALFGQARTSTITPNSGLTKRLQVGNTTGTSKVTEATGDLKAAATGATGALTATANGSAASVGQTVVLQAA